MFSIIKGVGGWVKRNKFDEYRSFEYCGIQREGRQKGMTRQ